MNRKKILVLLLISCALAGHAAEKPVIRLQVQLNDDEIVNKYRLKMPMLEMERIVGDSIAAFLNERVLVFQFSTQKPSSQVLHINFKKTDNSPLYGIKFQLLLSGADNASPCLWPCVDMLRYSDFLKDEPTHFISTLMTAFKNSFNKDELIEKQLGHVTIGNLARPDFNNQHWILNVTHREMTIGERTEFRVKHVDKDNNYVLFSSEVVSRDLRKNIVLDLMTGDRNKFNSNICKGLEGIQIIKVFKMTLPEATDNYNNR
ncbi:hypothetical protein KK083_28495 [Fulvivirgaceae bacterium PWU4]|uniref:Uncharacterized protein n=1 Tax=Chryseosolibacter histidini TaxID=2782349 RepID=A0AAP2DQZ3_9BACT|nr:hypothetical protein [Chryseosolibacter histidini]MBT1700865.1 hypothetical protein [Chryseosolibacter histidini]